MQRDFTVGQLALAALAWWACAAACMWLAVYGGVVSLIWWPNGIAVAVLFVLPYRKWPIFLAMGMVVGALDNWIFTMPPFRAFMIALANFAEVSVATWLLRRILKGKNGMALNLVPMFGMVGAALAGGVTSTLIMTTLDWQIATLTSTAWWCFSVSLGTLVATPLCLLAIDRFTIGDSLIFRDFDKRPKLRELVLTTLLVFGIALAVFRNPEHSLLFLPMAATIFAASRYGFIGATVSVLAISVAAGLQSLGGHTPAAFLVMPNQEAAVMLQLYMVVLLATSVPLAALLMSHDRLAVRLRHRNARLRENLTWLGMTEEISRIGRFRYDHLTGNLSWSRPMFRIYGLEPVAGNDPGNVDYLYPDGGRELRDQMDHHAENRARFTFEFQIRTPQGEDRILRMHAMNEFNDFGDRVANFGVVMDVTEHHQRQELLDKERSRAMRLAAEAQYLAQTDPLTGLANRRRTMIQLEKCIEQCEASETPLALIAFDIDHFKQVNDTFGHQVGDEVLVRIAEIAREQVRASDLIGRTGGEEFVWLLPDATEAEATIAAMRLCEAIAMGSGVDGLPTVTASIGYSVWQDGDTASSLLARADAGLYAAKDAGRNRVQKAA